MFRVIGRSGPGVSFYGRWIVYARGRDGSDCVRLGAPYLAEENRSWPLHPEWANGQYDIIEPVATTPPAAVGEVRRVDLASAMAVIGDLLAETLPMEGKWSPDLDRAREAGRNLLKEWSAKT